MKLATIVALASIAIGIPPYKAAADEVPTLDYHTTCRSHTPAGKTEDAIRACLAGEESARESLVKEWAQYAPEDKARCTRMATNIAGFESYVELFACLRAAVTVKSLPKNN